jgi:hypothetical protein
MSIGRCILGAALVAVAGLGGCASKAATGEASDVARERTTLTVENNNWQDMTVYVLRDGVRARLGSVPAMGRSNFTLADALIGGSGDLRLMADPLGSSARYTTQPIHVMRGQQVRFRLENNVHLSSYLVF